MTQTSAALKAWLTAIIATGKMYDPAATTVILAKDITDRDQDTAMVDLTLPTDDAADGVVVTTWSAPYKMSDGRWAVDSPPAIWRAGAGDPPQTVRYWALTDGGGTPVLKAWNLLPAPVTLAEGGTQLSLVVRLTIDPLGRFDATAMWNG